MRLKVDVIVTSSAPTTQAAQKATTNMPIVMVGVSDPVELGVVKSLAHPGGNTTGLSNIAADVIPKQLEMLLEIMPKLSSVAVLINPTNPAHALGLICKLLLAAGADPDIVNKSGQTARSDAEKEQHLGIVAAIDAHKRRGRW